VFKIEDDQFEVRGLWASDFGVDARECHNLPGGEGVGVQAIKLEELLEVTDDSRFIAPGGVGVGENGVAGDQFAVGRDGED
jgi:hypothetical protein